MYFDHNEEGFKKYLQLTKEPVSAALMVIAEGLSALSAELHDFDHQMALGIRMGFFGVGSSNNENIGSQVHSGLSDIAEAIKELTPS